MSVGSIDQLENPLGSASSKGHAWIRGALLPAVLAGMLLVSLGIDLTTPLSQDQGLYQYMTERVMAGDRLYVDVWDQNAPGIIGIHWLATRLCGRTSLALRSFDAGWQMATLVCLILLGRRDRNGSLGWLAAILYVVAYYGMGYVHTDQREGFAVLPMLLAVHAMAGGRGAGRGSAFAAVARYMLAGLMFSIVFAIKPPLGLTFGALWGFCLVQACRRSQTNRFADVVGLSLGFVSGVALAIMLLMHMGSWSAFWPTFTRARIPGYIAGPGQLRMLAEPVLLGGALLAAILWPFRKRFEPPDARGLKPALAGWLGAAVGATVVFALLLMVVWWPGWQSVFLRIFGLLIPALGSVLLCPRLGRSRIWSMQCLLAAAALACIILQGQFYLYQFPPLLACAAYLAANELIDLLGGREAARPSAPRSQMAWPLVCLACVTALLFVHWGRTMTFQAGRPFPLSDQALMQNYDRITRARPTFPRFDATVAVAARVRTLTVANDRIVCLLDEPRLYWLCQRPAACPLLRPCDAHQYLFPEFLRRIREMRPRILLARVPVEARGDRDFSRTEAAVANWATSFYGPDGGKVCANYRVSDVIDDVCIMQLREDRR